MTTKQIWLTGKLDRRGSLINLAPRQETLHSCPVYERRYGRNDMRIVDGAFKCVTCASDAQDESEEA